LLRILIDMQEKNPEDGLSDEEIVEEYITFLFAGMDTTGHLVTVALIALSKNLEAMEKTRKEAMQFLNKDVSQITMDDLNKMEYTTAVLKESLRMWTPAPLVFMRQSLRDHTLEGVPIKKGDLVNVSFISNFYDPKYFEDPETFNPDRWNDKDQDKMLKQNAYIFTPFSGGPRNCLGQHLAMMESKVILGIMLRDFDVISPKDYKLGMKAKFVYEPMDPFKVKLIPKKNQ